MEAVPVPAPPASPALTSALRQVEAAREAWRANVDAPAAAMPDAATPSDLGTIYYWVNSTIAFPKNTGIQRVTRQLARALADAGYRVVPVKWNKRRAAFQSPSPAELNFLSQWNGPASSQWSAWSPPGRTGNSWFMMAELPLDLTTAELQQVLDHAHDHRLRTAAIFYDAIPWKLKSHYHESFSGLHEAFMRLLRRFDIVMPISQYSRDDLLRFYAQDTEATGDAKITSVLLPGEFPEIHRQRIAHVRRDGQRLRLLFVSSLEGRKNHQTLIEAFRIAKARSGRDMELVLVGRDVGEPVSAYVEDATRTDASIIWESEADDTRLRHLFDACDFTVYPSVEEGFGLPILESLWCGKPCICADFGSMMEIGSHGGCLPTDVRDVAALADAIILMIHDDVRAHLAAEATTMTFKSWHDYASEVTGRMRQAQG